MAKVLEALNIFAYTCIFYAAAIASLAWIERLVFWLSVRLRPLPMRSLKLNERSSSIAVIGAGLSGLITAFDLGKLLPSAKVTVFDASDRIGGVIYTENHNDFLLEHGADSFSIQPSGAIPLCEDLGIADRLIEPLEDHRRAFILRDGMLEPVPEGFALLRPTNLRNVFESKLFSPAGRSRIVREFFVKARQSDEDESVESFAVRRFGIEAFERLIQPLVAGIYTADASRLSMQATMNQFVELERRWGGMIRASRGISRTSSDDVSRSASGARYGQFRSFPGGMAELFDALVANIGASSIKLGVGVRDIVRNDQGGWKLSLGTGKEDLVQREFDAVVVAVGAPSTSRLLRNCCQEAASELGQIPYASSALILLGVHKDQVKHQLDGFGMVVPAIEQRQILAMSFSSRKFSGRAPNSHHLIRVFIGGATQPELLDRTDAQLIELAKRELGELIGLEGSPDVQRVARWNDAMPQYHVGHCLRRSRINNAINDMPGLEIAGNGLEGVGIAHCIRTARAAARRVLEYEQKRGHE